MLERFSAWSKKRKIIVGCLVGIGVLLIVSALVSAFESEETKAARAEATAGAVQAKEAEEAAKRESGLHCLSEWDGHHQGFQRLVKDRLRDPDSLEARNTLVGKVGVAVSTFEGRSGQHIIVLDYTAANAFGGTVRGEAVGYLDSASCDAVDLVKVE